jgi:glycerophosphoryl diester phosphodiesterase
MLKIGHRGARAYEPENTLRSFRKALELGVDAVELDVRRTGSGEIIVIHDEKVDRTTNGTGEVNKLTLNEIKQLSTEKGEKIPTLEEALNCLDNKVKILIELKEPALEEDIIALVRDKGLKKNVVIVSFLEEALRKVRTLDSEIETGLLYVRHKNPIDAALGLGAGYILPLYRFTHSAFVRKAHENELKVIVWTINNREEASEYAKKEVDGIASDKPDILRDL